MDRLRNGAQSVLVYFGLATERDKSGSNARRREGLGVLLGVVVMASLVGDRRGLVLALIVFVAFIPVAALDYVAGSRRAARWADQLAGVGAVFAVILLLLSRDAPLWIPIAVGSVFAVSVAAFELNRARRPDSSKRTLSR